MADFRIPQLRKRSAGGYLALAVAMLGVAGWFANRRGEADLQRRTAHRLREDGNPDE